MFTKRTFVFSILLALVAIAAAIAQESVDHSFALSVIPWPQVTARAVPGVCKQGSILARSDQSAGSNLYECNASNQWVQIGAVGTLPTSSAQQILVTGAGNTPAWSTTLPNTLTLSQGGCGPGGNTCLTVRATSNTNGGYVLDSFDGGVGAAILKLNTDNGGDVQIGLAASSVTIPSVKSSSGNNPVCADTNGKLVACP